MKQLLFGGTAAKQVRSGCRKRWVLFAHLFAFGTDTARAWRSNCLRDWATNQAGTAGERGLGIRFVLLYIL